MFVELHMIQSFAPSNLNRDDTNNPKDCEFGGARRARISSQCIKRAIRRAPVFAETTGVENGTRTRLMARRLQARLLEAGKPEDQVTAVVEAFTQSYADKDFTQSDAKKAKKIEKGRTNVLIYLSAEEVRQIVDALLKDWDAALREAKSTAPFKATVKELVKQTKARTSAPDIALFGRMLADRPETNIDAACQVAHAISTHRVTMEMDFFTAVDDLQQEAEPGAGMINFIGFNSACFYRYARIDWDQLVTNLDGDAALARRTVEAFLKAANEAIPTGKQNSFAAQNPPSFLLAVVRASGMSGSLANAFETPVRPARDGGLVAPSVSALDAYWGRLATVYGADSIVRVAALAVDPGIQLNSLKDAALPNFQVWLDAVVSALPQEATA